MTAQIAKTNPPPVSSACLRLAIFPWTLYVYGSDEAGVGQESHCQGDKNGGRKWTVSTYDQSIIKPTIWAKWS